jgi:O-antigen/teichoic acid export membrane protein
LVGRVLSLGLGLVYVAVLARYVQAAGMGKIATATSLVSLLNPLVIFGLSELIVRDIARNRAQADVYVTNALLLRALLSVVLGLVIVAITAGSGYPEDTILIIYLFCIAYILDDLTDVAFSVFSAFEKMGYPAALQLGRDVVHVVWSLVVINLHGSLIAIVIVSVAASLLKLVVSLIVLHRRFVKPKLHIDWQLCRQLLLVSIPFAALGIIQLANRQIDTVLLSFYHPEEDVGWFSAANTLIAYVLLIPSAFLQATFPVFAKFQVSSGESLRQAYRASFRYHLLLGFPLCIGVIATAEEVIALVFGPGFTEAALALQIMALVLFWMFGYANGALLTATGGQTFLAVVGGIGLALNVGVALVLIPSLSYVGASLAMLVSGGVFFIPITIVCHRRLGLEIPYALALKALAASLLMGAAVMVSLRAEVNLFLAMFVIAPATYGGLLVMFHVIDREDWSALLHLFRGKTDLVPAGDVLPRN